MPCEKVIIDKETNAISVLAVLSGYDFPRPPDGASIPKGTMAAFNWAIFTMWLKEQRDSGEFNSYVP